jgi:hypothetical protein
MFNTIKPINIKLFLWPKNLDNEFDQDKGLSTQKEKKIVWCNQYYKMWVQFINPHSLDQWIHYYPTSPHLLRLANALKI